MNDMMGLGLMGMLGNGGGMGDFGMDQMGMGGAMGGGMPQMGVAGLFGGMGGMPMGNMQYAMPAMGLIQQLLMRKQQEEEMRQRREMFDKYLEMMKQRQMRRAPMQRPQSNERQYPLYTF